MPENQTMHEGDVAALGAAVEHLHHCQARFVRDERVMVTSGSVTFKHDVAIFELTGPNATAPLAYAWSDPPQSGEHDTRHRVVLHASAATSAHRAVSMFYLIARPGEPSR
jgi:hypothetical protein